MGILSATVFFFDKFKDIETDLERRANSLAKLVFDAEVKPNWMWFFFYSATVMVTFACVFLGFLPKLMLFSVFTFPIAHLTGILLEG